MPVRIYPDDLASLRFLDSPHGACLLGPVGVGKTHLATALGDIAVRRRVSTLMLRADALFKRLKATRLDNTVEAEMRRLSQVQLLIIDDFAVQPLDATETADFYELVVARHHKTSTVVTPNRDPSEWLAMMSDPLLAQSAVDPLTSWSSKANPTGIDRNPPTRTRPRRLTQPSRETTMLANVARWSHPHGKTPVPSPGK